MVGGQIEKKGKADILRARNCPSPLLEKAGLYHSPVRLPERGVRLFIFTPEMYILQKENSGLA